jgi:N-acetyl-anhydromuramyl-L-alanine amidase AmpD
MLKKLTIINGIIQDKFIDDIPVKIQIVEPKGKTNVRTLIKMKECIGITNHNTGNSTPSAGDEVHAKWIQNVENDDKQYVSVHLFVDQDSITQTIPLDEVTFNAGDGKGDGNYKTISIEICENANVDKAEENAKKLNASLILTYPTLKIFKHQDWSGKYCPRVILAKNGWNKFVEDINIYVKNATVKPIEEKKEETKVILPTLKKGSKGNDVKTLQQKLKDLGYTIIVDGDFGVGTDKIVRQFQTDNKLTSDGIVGKNTWNALKVAKPIIKPTEPIKPAITEIKGYQKIRRFDSDVYMYTTSKNEFVDVDLGVRGKLETVQTIINNKKKEGKKVVAGINCGFFNFSAIPEHLGMLIDDGLYYSPPSSSFIDFIYYKDGHTEIKNLNGYDKVLLSNLQAKAYWAIGTSWSLIQNGVINLENSEKFSHSTERHPRTLFGQKKDGSFVLVVVDGRSGTSKGVTAKQSAEIMKELDCWNSCNDDGGYSSQMVVNDKLVNNPTSSTIRPIGSTMLVYQV